MLNQCISVVMQGINLCFSVMQRIFDAIPGSWLFVLTFIIIIMIQKFLLGPLGFGTASDTVRTFVRKSRSDKATSPNAKLNTKGD